MEKFTSLTGVAAPLPMVNIDTDMVIPKDYLKTTARTGLGRHLFAEMRYREDGSERAEFVLNRPAYRQASILIAFENFGCGSSREHAPWALRDFGIRCVIAPSFADIFFNNCFKNGVLPIVLSEGDVDSLFQEVEGKEGYRLTIDLDRQVVVTPSGRELSFSVDSFRKYCMLNGLDEIGLTLRHADKIKAFEQKRLATQPWLDVPELRGSQAGR